MGNVLGNLKGEDVVSSPRRALQQYKEVGYSESEFEGADTRVDVDDEEAEDASDQDSLHEEGDDRESLSLSTVAKISPQNDDFQRMEIKLSTYNDNEEKYGLSTGLVSALLMLGLLFFGLAWALGISSRTTVNSHGNPPGTVTASVDDDLSSIGLAPNGVVCVPKWVGNLGDRILTLRGGLAYAVLLNRTLVVDQSLVNLYNIEDLNIIRPALVVKDDTQICRGAQRLTRKVLTKACKGSTCDLTSQENQQSVIAASQSKPKLFVDKNLLMNAMYSSKGISKQFGYDIFAGFYEKLFPVERLETQIKKYIDAIFAEQEYAALQLQDMSGSCVTRIKAYGGDRIMCPSDISPESVAKIQMDRTGRSTLPLYITYDNSKYLKKFGSEVNLFDRSQCQALECIVIESEIASRSNLFLGVAISSGSDLISKLRRYRRVRAVGTYYKSVLRWQPPGQDGKRFSNVDTSFLGHQ